MELLGIKLLDEVSYLSVKEFCSFAVNPDVRLNMYFPLITKNVFVRVQWMLYASKTGPQM